MGTSFPFDDKIASLISISLVLKEIECVSSTISKLERY